jgi:hypothetical protein
MNMSAERLRMLGLRWGLVALGATAFCTTRFLLSFLDDWLSIRSRTDWRVLGARLSQLRPPPWKSGLSGTCAVLLALALVAVVLAFFALGIRDALRPPPDED